MPALFADTGDNAVNRFIEFFTANIRNRNTQEAYFRAALRFSFWCEQHGLALSQITTANPAYAVRGPKHVVKIGKTPVLTATETRMLLDSISVNINVGLKTT